MEHPTMDAAASLTTQQKALALNLEPATYSGLAEIGARAELAPWSGKAETVHCRAMKC